MFEDKNLLILSIITLITVTFWIVVESITTFKETAFTEVPSEIAAPINPQINLEGVLD